MCDTTVENQPEEKKSQFSQKKLIKYVTISVLAFTAGYIHYKYVAHLFDNDRNFTCLSDVEREMSLRTEMGFYYSYYKTIVQERPFMAGITKLMNDRLVEHPNEVNAFNRFNIHPEVLIGALYRYLEPVLSATSPRECGVPAGLAEPILFYLEAVWVLAGLLVAGLFLHATVLSESVWGGALSAVQYFANHSECTRVQWTPNERENMAAPLLALQAALLTAWLRKQTPPAFHLQVFLFILNCLSLLFWQFTQFIFLTQLAIFFVMEQLRIIDIKSLCILLHSHFCGLHMAVLLLQGNDMLKSSLFASFFLVVSAYCLFFSSLRIKVENTVDFIMESCFVLLRILAVVCVSFYLKKVISDFLGVEEDSHVWDILYSKFSDYKTFHTLLYTCSEVFDFLPFQTVKKLTRSFLIPYAVIAVCNVCIYWLANAMQAYRKQIGEKEIKYTKLNKHNDSDDEDSGIENMDAVKKRKKNDLNLINKGIKNKMDSQNEDKDKFVLFLNQLSIEPAIFYNVSQMVVYGVMAALVMRLKLLFVPQMCVVSALVMNKTYYRLPKRHMKYLPVLWVLSFIPVVWQLVQNVSVEMSHIGEFSDIPQEELLSWISSHSEAGAAFAGSMPLMAAVMLVTRRAIVTHPHYEHTEARERAYTVYKVYGRFTADEYYEELTKLKVSYLIVETKYCYGRSNKGCSFPSIWAAEGGGRAVTSLCHALLTSHVDHFYPVYRDGHYAVFKLHDYSVRYMPRSFDT